MLASRLAARPAPARAHSSISIARAKLHAPFATSNTLPAICAALATSGRGLGLYGRCGGAEWHTGHVARGFTSERGKGKGGQGRMVRDGDGECHGHIGPPG